MNRQDRIWRLLDTPPMSAAENMALDSTLLEVRAMGKSPDTIHFLQFRPRAVLVGFHQSVEEEIRTAFCVKNNIDINRRITGGGAIFFDESQLGWEVICSKAFFGFDMPGTRLFKKLCDPVIEALHSMGIKARFRPRNDIEINGRKISGTGGTESDEAFLFQGTMLTDFDADTMLKALKVPIEKLKEKEIDSLKERVTCLKWELRKTPPLEDLKEAIKTGFEKVFGIKLVKGELTELEKRVFEKKLRYFSSEKWIFHVNPKYEATEVIQAGYKSKAGLVRFTLQINPFKNRIKNLFITGDFLSFPSRSLFDLEASLRGAPLDLGYISGVIKEFFEKDMLCIPDMSYEDFIKPLNLAMEKFDISSSLGIPIEQCNRISVTNGSFMEILKKGPDTLLLPYCSKLPECDLRQSKGCKMCGKCSIGDAWRMGLENNMEPVSIISFEDLIYELNNMKRDKRNAFIGCCCQPFFIKHVDDFKGAGVPGILLDIDNTTCYELDMAKEAYRGAFKNQTHVNLDLLNIVLSLMEKE